jgi:multimeric flavodoxin WrbA
MEQADGLVVGTPVHYSGIAGSMKCFLDRFFYAGKKDLFHLKPATAVASLRRSGGVATFDSLNHYFTISGMVVTSSSYWNVIHGNKAQETLQDLEGMQIMRNAGRNMAYVLKKLHDMDATPIVPDEKRIGTNFIR